MRGHARRRRRLHPAAVAAVSALFASRASAAAPTSFAVDVVLAEEGCPTSSALADSVHRLTGLPVAQRDDTAWFRVAFTRGPDGFEAQVRAPNGTRRVLDAQRCDQLLSAVAAVVALTLDPLPDDPSAAPDDVPPPPPAPPPRAPSRAPRPRFAPAVAAHGWATYGVAPTGALGADVDAELLPTAWSSVALGVAALAPQTIDLGRGHISHALVAAHAGACLYAARGRFSVGPCLDVLGGARFVAAQGVTRTRDATLGTAAVGAGGRLLARLSGPLALDLQVGALVPLPREHLVIAGESKAEVTGTVALSARLGLRYLFR